MAAITFPARHAVTVGPFHRLSRLAAALRAALDAQHDYQRLQTLSDRQLSDRGLTREDLPKVVFDRHFR